MERRLFVTNDGSPSFVISDKNLTYHSRFGAVQESMHVFINSGLKQLAGKHEILHVFEMGFGSGLNAFLTAKFAERYQQKIHYTCVELFPLNLSEAEQLTASNFFDKNIDIELMTAIHVSAWESEVAINDFFTLNKNEVSLLEYYFDKFVNLIYFDAFDPVEDPELWTTAVFKKLFESVNADGILVTYSVNGQVRRNLKEAGFIVEKIPGPPGKREITRAFKK